MILPLLLEVKAPKFYAGQSVRLTRIETKRSKGKKGERKILSQRIAASLDKDKTSPNMGKETIINYDVTTHQIDHSEEALAQGLVHGIIKRVGNTYLYKGKRYSKQDMLSRISKPKSLSIVQRKIRKAAIG